MSSHPERQELARYYGATDIVEERGEEGVARIKELTGGLGAHSVIEAVGTQESFMQAVGATRGGGHLGYVGVNHDVQIPGIQLFFAGIHTLGGPAPVRRYLPDLIQLIWDRKIDPGKVFDLTLPLERGSRGLPGHGPAHRHQGPAHRLSPMSLHKNDADRTAHDRPDRAARRRMWRRPATTSDDQSADNLDSTAQSTPTPPPSRSPASVGTGEPPDNQENRMNIQITIDDQTFAATLQDSAAARDLVAQLPVTVEMTDHGGVEKTGPLPAPLSLEGQPEGADPDVGDLGLLRPRQRPRPLLRRPVLLPRHRDPRPARR